jgi:hypothetical protein
MNHQHPADSYSFLVQFVREIILRSISQCEGFGKATDTSLKNAQIKALFQKLWSSEENLERSLRLLPRQNYAKGKTCSQSYHSSF